MQCAILPAEAVRALLSRQRRRVEALGYGRIERVELRETDSGPMLDVYGVDLLGELADRLVLRKSLVRGD